MPDETTTPLCAGDVGHQWGPVVTYLAADVDAESAWVTINVSVKCDHCPATLGGLTAMSRTLDRVKGKGFRYEQHRA